MSKQAQNQHYDNRNEERCDEGHNDRTDNIQSGPNASRQSAGQQGGLHTGQQGGLQQGGQQGGHNGGQRSGVGKDGEQEGYQGGQHSQGGADNTPGSPDAQHDANATRQQPPGESKPEKGRGPKNAEEAGALHPRN